MSDPTLALRVGSCAALAASVGTLAFVVASVPVPVAPRLGRRGVERRRALDAGGLFSSAEPLVRFIAGLVALLPVASLRARQETELRRAEYCLGLTPDEYSALSVLSAVGVGAFVFVIARLTDSSAVFAIPGAAFGLILPSLQVQEIIRKRVKEISRGLPHSIEIAAMCMGAGLDFPGTLRLLSQPTNGRKDALAREFSAILEELDLGHTRRVALLDFADRVPSPAVRDLVLAIIQAEEKGNPLAYAIQVQGRTLNLRRSVAAEEAAARAGVLMVVPMMLLVGCVLLLLMGPFLAKGVGL